MKSLFTHWSTTSVIILLQMENYFEKYFPSLKQSSLKFLWLVNPFPVEVEQLYLSSLVEDES
jgi:hypothetical protein